MINIKFIQAAQLFVLHVVRSLKTKEIGSTEVKESCYANTVVSRAVVWRLDSRMVRPHKHSDLHCVHREHQKVRLIDSFISFFVFHSS